MFSPQVLAGIGAGALIAVAGYFDPGSDLSPAPQRVASAFDGPVHAQVLRIIDGDTFEAAAQIWLGEAIDVHVRIAGIDAPELRARCDSEYALATAARDFLAKRIAGADVMLSAVRYDKYGGRVDAAVSDARGDVGAAMIKAHMARPYHGERRGSWCGQG
jgi:micrococcal nuclease